MPDQDALTPEMEASLREYASPEVRTLLAEIDRLRTRLQDAEAEVADAHSVMHWIGKELSTKAAGRNVIGEGGRGSVPLRDQAGEIIDLAGEIIAKAALEQREAGACKRCKGTGREVVQTHDEIGPFSVSFPCPYGCTAPPEGDQREAGALRDAYRWIRRVVAKAPDGLYADGACAECGIGIALVEGFRCVPHRAALTDAGPDPRGEGASDRRRQQTNRPPMPEPCATCGGKRKAWMEPDMPGNPLELRPCPNCTQPTPSEED